MGRPPPPSLTPKTLIESYFIGTVCARYAAAGATDAVFGAFALCVAVFAALTAFTLQSRIDFSFLALFIVAALALLLSWGLLILLMGWRTPFAFSLLGCLVFSAYVVFDTWLISKHLTVDEYVLAVVALYTDFLNLFLCLLSLFGGGSRN
jgi:protein lifeguard